MPPTRSLLIAEARAWIGTPYRHQASFKGVGCDCLGLVRGVWRAVHGTEPEATPAYAPDWAEARGAEALAQAATRHLVRLDDPHAFAPGDVLLFRYRDRYPAKHAAIATAPDLMVHARAVHAAITDKGADLRLAAEAAQRAESQWMAALADIGKAQVSEIGATMRAEAVSEDTLQRWWRPLYALELSLIECPAFALTMLHALWNGHESGINGFANLSGLLMTYFGARFGVLGVYVSGRSREKQTAITGEDAPSIVGTVVKAVTRKR